MTTLRQAAEIALEAMKDFDYDKRMAAIEAVEQALAEKEQEHCCPECGCHFVGNFPFDYKIKQSPQRQWVGLTDDETMLLANETSGHYWMEEAHIQRFRAAIEAKLKEKNHDSF